MGVGTLISLEEYLNTSYQPDREYRDGVLVERNVGTNAHALLQIALGGYLHTRRKKWRIRGYTELRIKVGQNLYRIPDLCVYREPAPAERYPDTPPLLWVEILSPDDRMADVWDKAKELIAHGVPYVWIINPETLDSELWTRDGVSALPDRTLRIPETEILIPLNEVMED